MTARREAAARVKIDRLLEEAGWRFFPDADGPANVVLEPGVPLAPADLDALGGDFENAPRRGFVDYLLLDADGKPLIVLEAKSERKEPLVGKEQARRYARSQKCRYVMLSNGRVHYFWDLEAGSPKPIDKFPSPESAADRRGKVAPDPQALADAAVEMDYIALSRRPTYASDAAWRNEAERPDYERRHGLRFLRGYQLNAVRALQRAAGEGKDRFLFEMATGTGKTLTAAAVIKLFLRTRNARRVLFLVDRLELEEQARRAFTALLSDDYSTVVYKERPDDWRSAEIVVSTVQSLLFGGKYREVFSPTDFDLVISDEAHRSISGQARGLFEFFAGYRLGLTATPKDYLRGASDADDPREQERRALRDTYRTFGCESGEPTFRYSLNDGVRDGMLVSPVVIDARTHVTTRMLSDEGFIVSFTDEETGTEVEQAFGVREFEKRFLADATNRVFCLTFLENALLDPISGEVGKSIVFAVSQSHAARLTQELNEMADRAFPGLYQSDFAVQVTSQVRDAQEFTRRFANNTLMGSANALPDYKTSKARVCVTVGMMTTGYDCQDLLNIALMRPVFSPTEFVQIKGRGTRPHNFAEEYAGGAPPGASGSAQKTSFKLFDFFAVCDYFEHDFNYDARLELPALREGEPDGGQGAESERSVYRLPHRYLGPDALREMRETLIGAGGMKIDRKLFDDESSLALKSGVALDKRLDEAFAAFVRAHPPRDEASLPALKRFFKAYAANAELREVIDGGAFAQLASNAAFSFEDLRAVPEDYRRLIPDYARGNLPLDLFAAG